MSRDEKVAEARRLRGEGIRQVEVARRLGVAPSTVRAWVSGPVCGCGMPLTPERWRPGMRCRGCLAAAHVCACGCGQPAGRWPDSRQHRKYCPGHAPTIRRLTEDYAEAPGPLESPCWLWRRKLTAKGYALTTRDGEVHAHRWYYKRLVGPIPEGLELHHACEVKACVNPAHLEPLTLAEHRRRHAEHQRPVAGCAPTHETAPFCAGSGVRVGT